MSDTSPAETKEFDSRDLMSDVPEDAGSVAADPPAPVDPLSPTPCGLPKRLADSKRAIVDYVNQYGFDVKDRKGIERTPFEQTMYAEYRKTRRTLAAPHDYFFAALRLWKAGYPIVKPPRKNLNDMKVESDG